MRFFWILRAINRQRECTQPEGPVKRARNKLSRIIRNEVSSYAVAQNNVGKIISIIMKRYEIYVFRISGYSF